MRGKYSLQDLEWRKRQHLANEVPGPLKLDKDTGTITQAEERDIDTQQRELSVVTNGQGAQGKDNPISAENREAFQHLALITGWARDNLKPTNKFVRMMDYHFNALTHTVFDRSVERDEPEVVLTYKPMIFPGANAPVESQTDTKQENAKKKP